VHLEKGQLLESAEMEAKGLIPAAPGSNGIQVAPPVAAESKIQREGN
jgi:hypothetical protein